ncbi:hypothetical protein MMC18_002193 [Xylographa bjoerkii]|nr:hypothetical protein [Xylographa bjoerkii]
MTTLLLCSNRLLIIMMKESNLKTFDLALGIPSRSDSHETVRTLQVLVLTPASLDENMKANTMARIEHFSALGGDSIAITFMFSTSATAIPDSMDGLRALSTLQLMILAHSNVPSLPILPITNPFSFLLELNTYLDSLHHYSHLTLPQFSVRTNLLRHTTSSAPSRPLSEHNTNILSDICHSLSDVAKLADSEQGYLTLEEWLEDAGKGVTKFWQEVWEL